MRLNIFALTTILLITVSGLIPDSANGQDKPNKEAAKKSPIGYFLGVSIGQQMAAQGFAAGDFDVDSVASGVVDGLKRLEPALSDDELSKVRTDIEALLKKRQEEKITKAKAEGEAFLKQNAAKEGVQKLEGGLQYKVVKEGDGDGSPAPDDTVRVHYTGKLINDRIFDSSVKRGKPAEFRVNQVIKGWQTALQKMKVGDKWMLYIPPELGYGKNGSPPNIGPHAVLIFEVELLDIL